MRAPTIRHAAVALIAAAVIAVIPPVVLGIRWLWFITPVLGLAAGAGILWSYKSLLLCSAVLLLALMGAGGILSSMGLSANQRRQHRAVAHFLSGETFFLKGDYADALQAYTASLESGLDHPWAAYQSARCHTSLGNQDVAFRILSRLKDSPDSIPLWVILPDYGVAAFKAGEFQKGKEAFYGALDYNFKPGYCYYQLGILYRRQGKVDSARANLSKAHRLWQNRSECSFILGKIAEERGEYARAEELYRRSLEENPENLRAYTRLGLLLSGTERTPEALRVMKRGLELLTWKKLTVPAQAAEFCNAFGNLYANQRRLGKATMFYRLAINNNPQYLEAYLNLAQVYFVQQRRQEAVAVLKQALRINPSYIPARKMLEVMVSAPPDTAG